MLGKLNWSAIPFGQPIPLAASAIVGLVVLAALAVVTIKGYWPYLWREWITSVDHKRIGVMYCALALIMLLRGFTDAIMMRSQQASGLPVAGLSAAGALRPDLLGPRHDHDLLRRHDLHDRPDELRGAAPARRSRRRLPDFQLGVLLADRVGCAAGQHVSRGRRIRQDRLARLSTAVGAAVLARGRCRLLFVGDPDLRHRHVAHRHQLRHDDPQGSCPRHDLHADADLLLDRAGRQSPHGRGLPDPDRDPRNAAPRPLSGVPFLHDGLSAATR